MAGLIVHEWVAKAGGSEKVVDQFVTSFPDADIQVLWTDDPDRFEKPVKETWLAKTPLRNHKAAALPLLPLVWRRLCTNRDPDWMLVSSHLFAHHALIPAYPSTPKLVYAHTPARYIWEPDLDHRGRSLFVRMASSALKPLDRRRAAEATSLVANSAFTQARIQRAWDQPSQVIYPPVDTHRIVNGGDWRENLTGEELSLLESLPAEFVLGASRFVPYKRLDLVIACAEANELPAVLAGSGPDYRRLRHRADASPIDVRFIERPSDALLYALYQRSRVYVFPAIEDFGIMPVEAMATGTPVIVPATGGASESVSILDGGATFSIDDRGEWRRAFDAATTVDRKGLKGRTHRFSNETFREKIEAWVETGRDR